MCDRHSSVTALIDITRHGDQHLPVSQPEPGAFGTGDNSDPVTAMLNRDDNWTFAMFPPYS